MIIDSIIVVVLGVFPVRPIGRRRGSLANVKFSVCSCCMKYLALDEERMKGLIKVNDLLNDYKKIEKILRITQGPIPLATPFYLP